MQEEDNWGGGDMIPLWLKVLHMYMPRTAERLNIQLETWKDGNTYQWGNLLLFIGAITGILFVVAFYVVWFVIVPLVIAGTSVIT